MRNLERIELRIKGAMLSPSLQLRRSRGLIPHKCNRLAVQFLFLVFEIPVPWTTTDRSKSVWNRRNDANHGNTGLSGTDWDTVLTSNRFAAIVDALGFERKGLIATVTNRPP